MAPAVLAVMTAVNRIRAALQEDGERWFFAFLLAAAGYLHALMFVVPFTPLAYTADHTVFLNDAFRMLNGERIYRDFFAHWFPGTPVVYLAIFKLAGVITWIPNAVFVGLGLSLTAVGVLLARRLVSGWLVYVPSLLFLALSLSLARDATHHYFSALWVALGIVLLQRSVTTITVMGVGIACAFATWFTYTRGVCALVGFALFLCYRTWRSRQSAMPVLAAMGGSFAGSLLLLLLPSLGIAGWRPLFEQAIVFPWASGQEYFALYAFLHSSEFPIGSPWYVLLPVAVSKVFTFVIFPGVFLVAVARAGWLGRHLRPEVRDRVLLISIVGTFCFLSIAVAPRFIRIAGDSLLAFVVLTWCLERARHGKTLLVVLCSIALLMMAGMLRPRSAYFAEPVSGRVAFRAPDEARRWQWLAQHLREGEYVFEPAGPFDYSWFRVHNPATVPFLTDTSFTTAAQVDQTIQGLRRRRPRIILWDPELLHPLGPKGRGDHLASLRSYIWQEYRRVRVLTHLEVWERMR